MGQGASGKRRITLPVTPNLVGTMSPSKPFFLRYSRVSMIDLSGDPVQLVTCTPTILSPNRYGDILSIVVFTFGCI